MKTTTTTPNKPSQMITIAATCLFCQTTKGFTGTRSAWRRYRIERHDPKVVFRQLNPLDRIWITRSICPRCYLETIHAPQAPTETINVTTNDEIRHLTVGKGALGAYKTGDLDAHQAFPQLSTDDRNQLTNHLSMNR